MATKSPVTKWKISKLKNHPKQAARFGDVSDQDLEALAASMQKGLRDPVEVLPDGTIVAGHQSVRAAKHLEWEEIDVIVRPDLAAAGAAAIEIYFIEDNFIRRHLSPLGRARCIQRLIELEHGKKEDLKERIARRMDLSVRSVSRYLLILKAPVAVQRAFDRGEISLTLAGKVGMLCDNAQLEIARRIEAGEKASMVVTTRLIAKGGTGDEGGRAFERFVRSLRHDLPFIQAEATELCQRNLITESTLGLLQDTKQLLHEIIKRTLRKRHSN